MSEIIEPQKAYAVRFKMVAHAYQGAIRVYDDGEGSIHRNLANEDRPVLVEVEGKEPTQAQLATLKLIWDLLHTHFNFGIVDFCPVLIEHQAEIMPIEVALFVRDTAAGQQGTA